MSGKKTVVSILLGLVAVVGVSLSIIYSSASDFTGAESKQSMSAVERLRGALPNEKHVIVLYKRNCSTCKAWGKKTVTALGVYSDYVSYVDVQDEVPREVQLVLDSLGKEVHTPYVMVVEKAPPSFYVSYSVYVNSDESIEGLSSHLKEIFK